MIPCRSDSEIRGDLPPKTELPTFCWFRREDGPTVYVYEPTNAATHTLPVVVRLHGGGMAMFSAKDKMYVRFDSLLAAQGLIVVAVDFRNSAGSMGPYPFLAGPNDVQRAIQWAQTEYASHTLVLSGDSGGSNLALFLLTVTKAKLGGALSPGKH